MRPAKIAAIVGGILLVLIGLALILPGGFLFWAYGTQRDSAGFYETSSRVLSTNAYALTTPNVDLGTGPWNWTWIPKGGTAAVRIEAESTGSAPLFIGIGPTDRVSEYLSGVAHDEVTNFAPWSRAVDYRHTGGGAPRSVPGQQDFWVAKQEGSGSQTLEWQVQGGNWTAVMMNADGSAEITAAVSLGARFGALLYIAIGLTVVGVVLLAVGVVLIVLGARRPRPPSTVGQALPPEYSPEVRPTGTNTTG
jgi:hypothetical protein